ncbi:MAG: polyamine aminopropyltransferase [Candidatus Electrothrix sp. Rat3]|nr:polyamine aminopropyltransferase [Candidatus Electrothrix rattekaaiensis]
MPSDQFRLTKSRAAVLQVSVLVVALCGIVYELLIATVSSYLLGDSVRQFSVTIGLFMAAMGLGAYITRFVNHHLIARFVIIEILVALVGGLSTVILFLVFPWTGFYQPTMYGLIIIIGTLVGMEIPLLTRVLSETGDIRRSIADVLSLDYVGALIGSVAFPLFLLPFLGLFRASFVIGFFNAGVALFNVAVFSTLLRFPRRYAALALLVCALLISTLITNERITAFAEGQLYADRIIFSEQTPYQKIVLTREEGINRHRLYLDGHIQFAEVDEYRYHEALVHPVLSSPGPRKEVLILGGGDGLAVREILKYNEVQRIILVDIDPAITRICSTLAPITRLNQGSLDDPRVRIYNEDAFAFLRQSKEIFDRVIIDLPDPHNEALSKLYSVEFYTLLARRLTADGLVVSQSTSPLMTRETFRAIGETMGSAGFEVLRYKVNVPSFAGDWGFTLAGRPGHLPTAFAIPEAKTRFLTSRVMEAATVFAKDEQVVSALTNSLFEPKLYLTYNREAARW